MFTFVDFKLVPSVYTCLVCCHPSHWWLMYPFTYLLICGLSLRQLKSACVHSLFLVICWLSKVVFIWSCYFGKCDLWRIQYAWCGCGFLPMTCVYEGFWILLFYRLSIDILLRMFMFILIWVFPSVTWYICEYCLLIFIYLVSMRCNFDSLRSLLSLVLW